MTSLSNSPLANSSTAFWISFCSSVKLKFIPLLSLEMSSSDRVLISQKGWLVVKLPAHPVRTGQARRGRSTEFTTLSISNGLPVKEVSFTLYPVIGSCRLDPAGHVPANRLVQDSRWLAERFMP